MRILFNHHISGAADVISLMRKSCPDLVAIATHERSDTPIRRVADRFLIEPGETRKFSAEEYAAWLLEIAITEKADLVIPYRRRDELADFKDEFKSNGIRLLTASDRATMLLLEDKPEFLSLMAAQGIAVTPFRVFHGLARYERLRAYRDLFPDYPGDLCVKPVSGIYGAGFRILRNNISQTATLASLSSLEMTEPVFRAMLGSLPGVEPMMLMPFLPGPERSVDFACLDGRLLGTVARTKAGTSQRLYHDPYGESLASLIARKLNLSGVLNLQTIEDAHGQQRLLEVNSRAAGGVGMTGLTSVNLPGLFLDALSGRGVDTPQRVSGEVVVAKQEVFWEV